MSSEIKEKILSKIPLDSTKTKGLSNILNLAEDLHGELSINVDVSDGLTNGTPCIIKKLDYRVYAFERCSIVWVLFTSSDISKKCRVQFSHLYNSDIHFLWTPILEVTRKSNTIITIPSKLLGASFQLLWHLLKLCIKLRFVL